MPFGPNRSRASAQRTIFAQRRQFYIFVTGGNRRQEHRGLRHVSRTDTVTAPTESCRTCFRDRRQKPCLNPMPDTNGASVSRTGMKDAEALEQIDQTTAAATQGNEAETARNGQVGQTITRSNPMTQLFPNGLHGEKGRRSGVVQIMLDALGAAELHFDIQRPQRKALGRQSALDDIERARAVSRITSGTEVRSAAHIPSRPSARLPAEVTSTSSSCMKVS